MAGIFDEFSFRDSLSFESTKVVGMNLWYALGALWV